MSLMALWLGYTKALPKSKQWKAKGLRLVISTTAQIAKSLMKNLMSMFLKRKEINMAELKVGERVTLEVIEQNVCNGCDD